MLTPEQIALYAPQNAKNLSQDQLAAMAGFTQADLKQLAEAYPNGLNTYLILKDTTKPDNKQLFSASTWKNLFELHKVGQKHFIALSYKSIFNRKDHGLKVAPVQDLTQQQAKAELAKATSQTAKKSDPGPGTAEEQTAKTVTNPEAKEEKPLIRMNKKELLARYQEVYGEEAPEELATNRQLIAAIEEKVAEEEAGH